MRDKRTPTDVCGEAIVEVILVDLIQLELLSYFSRDKEKGDQNVLK